MLENTEDWDFQVSYIGFKTIMFIVRMYLKFWNYTNMILSFTQLKFTKFRVQT